MAKWLVLAFLLVIRSTESRREYEVEIEAVEVVRDPKSVLKSDFLCVSKYNQTTMVINMSGNITEDLPIDTMVTLTAYEKLNSNKYSMIPVKLISSRLCEVIKYDKMFYPRLRDAGNYPSDCPIKKGHYWVKNFTPNMDTLPDQLPGERWRCEQVYTSLGRTLFKMNGFVYLKRV